MIRRKFFALVTEIRADEEKINFAMRNRQKKRLTPRVTALEEVRCNFANVIILLHGTAEKSRDACVILHLANLALLTIWPTNSPPDSARGTLRSARNRNFRVSQMSQNKVVLDGRGDVLTYPNMARMLLFRRVEDAGTT